ncbi:MAG: hypothetical protein NTW87_13810, partial [Planctomycetota bacterium]|nr:hypothetical protein [Planctomycetota bacterium]
MLLAALFLVVVVTVCMLSLGAACAVEQAEFLIGAATTSITPGQPVALAGQYHTRIARTVEAPITATAVAIEGHSAAQPGEAAIMVSCDLVGIGDTIQPRLRERLRGKLPGFDLNKLWLSATHTHTAPVGRSFWEDGYVIPKEGVMQPAEFIEFLLDRLGEVVVKAWEGRQPGGVSWALGHAVVGHNRRAVYENGRARMYGATNTPDFRALEGGEDHGVEMLFFWDQNKAPLAIAINVACTAQEVEGRSAINADFWHDVREQLRAKYGQGLCVLAWCGAAGDQSPHLLFRQRAEERMQKLRGLSRTQEMGCRISRAVDEVYELARNDIRASAPFVHQVQVIKLPRRKVTDEELARAKARHEELSKKAALSPDEPVRLAEAKSIMDRYEQQNEKPDYEMELHVIRLGDAAIATNPFELYLDYGLQIKARSKATQTFVVQLSCAAGFYLPTEKGVRGGHYSTEVGSVFVGPEGGQVL